jgi:alanyl-tRNA synthetase
MKKRYDPRMHTAEHILNQTMDRVFGCGRCISAHIEKKRSKCDYLFDRPLNEAEKREIEDRVNGIIAADLPVAEEWTSKENAQAIFNLGRLPEDAGDTVRIVKVGDYDACPCIGAHVSSTGEIGRFQITTTGFESGVLRIRYRLRGS